MKAAVFAIYAIALGLAIAGVKGNFISDDDDNWAVGGHAGGQYVATGAAYYPGQSYATYAGTTGYGNGYGKHGYGKHGYGKQSRRTVVVPVPVPVQSQPVVGGFGASGLAGLGGLAEQDNNDDSLFGQSGLGVLLGAGLLLTLLGSNTLTG